MGMGDNFDKEYWDGMARIFVKERTIEQISYQLAKLIEYYSHGWTPERIYVCEKILEHIKRKTCGH
jgi:hypothetical protein